MKENNRGKNRLNNNEKKDNKFDKKPDSNLPFFAYGIFKPGQIAYSKISGLDFSLKEASINYLMNQRRESSGNFVKQAISKVRKPMSSLD